MLRIKMIMVLIASFIYNVANSQNIFTALQINQERSYKTVKPKKIVEINTFYTKNGQKVEKSAKTFDLAGMIVLEERFDENGKLIARLSMKNDTINRLMLVRIFERWYPLGYSKETAYYDYNDLKCLIKVTDKDDRENIIRTTELTCNEKGYPTELKLFENDKLVGKEIATYLYDKNKVITSVIANNNEVISTDTTKISFKAAFKYPTDDVKYNTYGDLVNWKSTNLNGEITHFEADYVYDKFGNSTEYKHYKIIIKSNGKRKREIIRELKRIYTY